MNSIKTKLKNMKTKHTLTPIKMPLSDDIENNSYISDTIKNKMKKEHNSYLIKYNGKNQIYVNTNTPLTPHLIKTMIKIKKLMKNDKPLHINLMLTNEKKKLDFNKTEIGPEEVNSGSTTYHNLKDNGIITIWRNEELEKVLIHELLHALHTDSHELYNDRLSEGHTESLATLLRILLHKKDHNKALRKEQKHFEKQMNKIQYYINKKTPEINTHVQEYYFDKAQMLKYPNDFAKYAIKNKFKFNRDDYQQLLNKNKQRYGFVLTPKRGTKMNMTTMI